MNSIIDNFKKGTESLNENKYFIGVMMILLNLGARFIIDELGDDIRSIISDKIIRKIFIFCVIFIGTRDIIISFVLTIIFIIIINEFLVNEEEINNQQNGGTYTKSEINKTIEQLKNVSNNL
tara:strand:- start:1161 stop:1526 length:366 start_codon:yes stop_codon:yes gene_type:complete